MDNLLNSAIYIHLVKIRQECFRFFSADNNSYKLQMYTLHSIDNNSTLKKNLFDHQKDFYSYFLPCAKYTQTHRKIFHGGSHGVDVEK